MKTAAALIAAMLASSVAMRAQAVPAPSSARPAEALSATIRLSFVKSDAAPGPSASAYAGFGTLLARMLTPDGPVNIHYTVSAEAMRAEIDGRLSILPAGAVVIERLGEATLRILNPAQKTWYEVPAGQSPAALLGTPDIDLQPTHERTTIAGQLAERFQLTETMHVPPPQGVAAPPDFPSEIQFTGDVWSTDALKDAAARAIAKSMQTFAAVPGMDALTADGRFPLRVYLRSDVMPGLELRTEVTSLVRTTPDAASFTVPSDYQKVQPPYGGGEP